MSIRFVTDSCSDIPWDYAKKNKIKVVPLSVLYNDKVFKETPDFDLEKHYNNYKVNPNFLPKTSQPTPGEYFKVYEELIKEGASSIIVICVSSKLSGTINSAQTAAKMIKNSHPEINFYFIDSLNASYSEVFLIEEGLDLVKKGVKIDKIIEKLESLKRKIKTYIFIPTLKFLHLNGRISLTKYLLGKLLRKKVIIRVNEEGAN